jgi:tetratricopeptide (TPR) repeat protein
MVMAIIYIKCGQFDKALDELEELLAQQTPYSVNDLKLNEKLEPLRKLPRYQKLLEKYGT